MPESSAKLGASGRKGRRFLPIFSLAPLLLAACAGPLPTATSSTGGSTSSSPATAASTPVSTRAALPQPAPRFEELKGLNQTKLVDLLGDPDFRRKENPGELWQYRTADCVLDVFLYSEGKETKVRHVETRDRGLLKISKANCLNGLVAARSRLRESRT